MVDEGKFRQLELGGAAWGRKWYHDLVGKAYEFIVPMMIYSQSILANEKKEDGDVEFFFL